MANDAKERLMNRFEAIAPAIFEAAKVPELAADELAAMKDPASLSRYWLLEHGRRARVCESG